MAVRDVLFRIRARDDTADAGDAIQGRFGSIFAGIAAAGAAAVAQFFSEFVQTLDQVEERLRNLRTQTGIISEAGQEVFNELIGTGISEAAAIDAIGAVAGRGSQFGLNVQSPEVTNFAQASELGVNVSQVFQAAQAFGVTNRDELLLGTETLTSSAIGRDVSPGGLFSQLAEYGPVLNALGLSFAEAGEFALDLDASGINLSRVSPALNRFIRDASALGVDPRARAEAEFSALASGDAGAIARGQEVLGAEGGLRLQQALESGQVGFGPQLGLGYAEGLPNLSTLAEPTNLAAFEGELAELAASGTLGSAAATGVGLVNSIPGLDFLLRQGVGRADGVGGGVIPAGAGAALAGTGVSPEAQAQYELIVTLGQLRETLDNQIRQQDGEADLRAEAQRTVIQNRSRYDRNLYLFEVGY